MNQSKSTWQLFEDLVSRILAENGLSVQRSDSRGDAGFDLVGNFGGEDWAIEVKYYRTARPQFSLIETAAIRLANNAKQKTIKKGMLVVSCVLSEEFREAIEKQFRTHFINIV